MGRASYQSKKCKHLAKPIMIGNIYRLRRELVENIISLMNSYQS